MRVALSGVDPVASLYPRELVVDVAGAAVVVPALYAIDWLVVLLAEDLRLDRIFPGLCDEANQDLVDHLIIDGLVTPAELDDLALDVLTEASGRAWFVTVRTCATARASWDRLGGALATADPARMTLGSWLDAAYFQMLQMVDPKKIKEFTVQLTVPPAGWGPEYDEAAEEANFMAMLDDAM
jgi:hypothetical protein